MLVNAALTDTRIGLFVYDSIITFNLECRAIWACKFTGATALYVALRYVSLANVIATVIMYTIPSCEVSLQNFTPFLIILAHDILRGDSRH